MKRILVPCDFSNPSIQAYKFGMEIASAAQGNVTLLKVIDLPFLYESAFGLQPPLHNPSYGKELEDEARHHYEKLNSMYGQLPAPVSLKTERGPVKRIILSTIAEQKIDLVVMGTNGAGAITNSLVGTNTARIIRSSPVPVISLRKALPLSSIRNIVFPVALDADQKKFTGQLKSLQSFFKAKLHILLVNTPFNFRSHANADKAMEEFVKNYEFENYTIVIRNEEHASDGILNYVTESKSDMIAMGTHAYKGIWHLLHGSFAEDIVSRAECPVWVSEIKE